MMRLFVVSFLAVFIFALSFAGHAEEKKIIVEAGKLTSSLFPRSIIGEGKVKVRFGEILISAEKIEVNLTTGEVKGWGNILLQLDSYKVKGKTVGFNLRKNEGFIEKPQGREGPIIFKGIRAYLSLQEMRIEEGNFTTCDLPHPHYHIKAKIIEFYPGEKVVVRNAVFYLGSIPLFWTPVYVYYLKKKNKLMFPDIGYSEIAGGYIKTGYLFYPFKDTQGVLHLDYRQRKGWASGFTLSYSSERGKGSARVYYVKEKDTENSRGIARINYTGHFPTLSLLKLKLNCLSDRQILDDYFSDLPFEERQDLPSYLALDSRRNDARLFFQLQKRLNFFDDYTEMLPRIKLNILHPSSTLQKLYIEGQAELTNFVQEKTTRFWSSLTFSYPFTVLRYIRFKPALGWEFFLYSGNDKANLDILNLQSLEFFISLKGRKGNLTHYLSSTVGYYRSTKSGNDFPSLDYREEEAREQSIFKVSLENKFLWGSFLPFYLNLGISYDFLSTSEKFKPVQISLDLPFNNGRFYTEFFYDFYDDGFPYFRSGFKTMQKNWQVDIGYTNNSILDKEFITGSTCFDLGKNLSLSGSVGYDLKLRKIEDLSYAMNIKLHCLGLKLGVKEKPRLEYNVSFYITAFPF